METANELPAEARSPEVQKLTSSALQLADNYENYSITNADDYQLGAEHLKQIKAAQATLKGKRLAITRPMDAAKNAVMALFSGPLARLDAAETHVKQAIGQYRDEQQRIADARARAERERVEKQQRELREKARKADEAAAKKRREKIAREKAEAEEKARIERERLAEEQRRIDAAKKQADAEERARLEAKQRRIDEERRREAEREEQEQARLHQEQMDAEAEQLERTARAEALEAKAEAMAATPIASEAPKVEGISGRKVWKYAVTDAEKIPRKYLKIDEKKLGQVVRALKDDCDIPGIRVYAETSIAARKA